MEGTIRRRDLRSLRERKPDFTYTHSATIFKSGKEVVFVRHEPTHRNVDLNNKGRVTVRGQSLQKEENLDRATRRARKAAKELIENNDFNAWGTITVDPKKIDRSDPVAIKEALHKVLKAIKRNQPDFAYVIIPEHHKQCESCQKLGIYPRGTECPCPLEIKPLHFHCVVNNLPDLVPAYNPKFKGQMRRKGHLIYNAPVFAKTIGHTDFEYIDSKEGVTHYVAKYITKDTPTFADKKRYWSSRNLERPTKLTNPPQFNILNPPPSEEIFENEHGRIYTYKNANLFTAVD